MIQRKRTKNGNDILTDLEALRMEDLDSTIQSPPIPQPALSYASMLKNPIDRYRTTMTEDFEFTDADCTYTQGKHGQNISFSEKVHNKLDFDWRCAVVVKLMGKPNSTNTFDFMLKGLRRKWQTKGGWHLIDLPNDFFIVKFNLEDDMNAVLCGGPWILAGQTLIVRKWSPDFDPMNEVIGKMALWVRICGLPVKYFKDFTVAKIGKILGDVVKVDQVTIGQARGKFARVCIEVDLSKPLRPYVEVDSVAYNVVYEGISLICFECGCFGHSKDKCPTVVAVPNAPLHENSTDRVANDQALANTENHTMQHDMDTPQATSSVIKEDMGPWMLMNYRNKKKNEAGGTRKNVSKGSRFAVLQDEEANVSNETETMVDNSAKTPTPPIVKLWTSFRDKKKKLSKLTPTRSGVVLDTKVYESNSLGEPTLQNAKTMVTSSSKTTNVEPRIPMKDVSNNIGSCSSVKSTLHYQRKSKGLTPPTSKPQSLVFTKLSFDTNGADVFGNGIAAIFGHCPPEERSLGSDLQTHLHHDSNFVGDAPSPMENDSAKFAEMTFAANSLLTNDDCLPSNTLEGVVNA